MTLLEKAKKIKHHVRSGANEITDDHVELAIAWARGEITYTQAFKAIYHEHAKNTMGVYVVLARSLAKAVREKKLK